MASRLCLSPKERPFDGVCIVYIGAKTFLAKMRMSSDPKDGKH